jgi:hypothetical protein
MERRIALVVGKIETCLIGQEQLDLFIIMEPDCLVQRGRASPVFRVDFRPLRE